MKSILLGAYMALIVSGVWSSAAWSGPFTRVSDWVDSNVIDSQDGKLDVSEYLASSQGLLPVPIIISEPAVGFGVGLAVAYFHSRKEMDATKHSHQGPPSMSVGFGAITENGTYLYGGAHIGVWKADHIRYVGALAKANINMTFYTDAESDGRKLSDGIQFNIDGNIVLQQIQFRLKESNWWLGTNYLFVDAMNTFKLPAVLPPELPDPQFDFNLAGLGIFAQYDSRNSIFTPTQGLSAKLEYKNYGDSWGSDFNFNRYKGSLLHYTRLGDYSSLGLRLAGETVSGDTPFFGYPFIFMRGIPAMRYQGESAITGEAEYLWGITPRWVLSLFGGAGGTSDINSLAIRGQTVGAGGLGFRYRLARKLGLQAGVDIARRPEDTSIYIVVGSAWVF
ncbi:hypothetical protein DRQ53_08915 [bacterium]|nr:MAG: hypothetical protein DRQ53_08915 [bacterium]